EVFEGVVRTGYPDRTLDGDPLPAAPEDHGRPAAAAQVGQLAGRASGDEADDRPTRYRVVDDARVDQRRVDGPVGTGGGHDRQPAVRRAQAADEIEACHVVLLRRIYRPPSRSTVLHW